MVAVKKVALYRITQEALTNIRKHARATGVQVDLSFDASTIRLEISDDGWGFEVPDACLLVQWRLAHEGEIASRG